MKMRRSLIFVVLIVFSSVVVPTINAENGASNSSDCSVSKEGDTRVIQSYQGICIKSHFENGTIDLVVSNPTSEYVESSGALISVDGHELYEERINIHSNSSFKRSVNINRGLEAFKDNHSIFVSTFGDNTTYNYIRKVDTSDSPGVLTPYIANISVDNGTIDGEQSAVAYVTVVNPSIQTYSSKLFVHTVGTKGSFYAASVRPGGTRTIKVELLDKDGRKIAGEARLYTGNLTKRENGIDQVGFVGKAGEQTKTWNESFEPVRPTWMDDHYRYENDTYSRSFGEKLSGGYEIGGIPVAYVLFSLLGVVVVIRRLR